MMTDNWKDITDPEELFRLKREGWDIEKRLPGCQWEAWDGRMWSDKWMFQVRPPQPKMKKVKQICLFSASGLRYDMIENYEQHELLKKSTGWTRVPSEDKEIEVPDDL